VVVALYNPYSEVDGIAFAEARAGAKIAGVGFVPLSVLSEAQVGNLTQMLGMLPDPGLLVYIRPGTLVARISGFADKETSRAGRPERRPRDVTGAAPEGAGARELFVRHARRDGRSVAILRAVDYGDSCVVEAEVYPAGGRSAEPSRPGPYTFADVHQATAFMTEAVEALMVLGCDVHAQ